MTQHWIWGWGGNYFFHLPLRIFPKWCKIQWICNSKPGKRAWPTTSTIHAFIHQSITCMPHPMTAKLIFLIIRGSSDSIRYASNHGRETLVPLWKEETIWLIPRRTRPLSRGRRPAIGGVSPPLTGRLACHWLARCRRPKEIQLRIAERHLKTPSKF